MNQSKPLSELLKSKDDSEPKKQSREEWRQQRELEEARKLGNAPAAVDETGKDINPHIPQYISTVPWYVGSSGPTLKHQRPQPEKQSSFSSIHEGYYRGTSLRTATKYREGACENCGAMGHKKKECFERPRKIGAKYTNRDIAPDDFQQPELNMNFDGKRDRWNGYDPSHYKEVVEEYRRVEEAKRLLKEQKLKEENDDSVGTSQAAANNEDSDDEDKYADKIDMPGTKVDSKQRITVRNLRIREDTAKYLRNLDPDSAHYDPKTRSMRDNPYKNTGKTSDEVSFAGENFVRFTGDTKEMLQDQAFAWEAHNSGVDIHLLAEPTKASMLTKEFKTKKVQVQESIKTSILDKYGGEEHLQPPPKELLFSQSEHYIEYSRTGQIIKGAERKIIRSKYEEDVFINNHTTVWGSYWEAFKWGYKCCHSFVKNSYCTGSTGKLLRESSTNALYKRTDTESDSQPSQDACDAELKTNEPQAETSKTTASTDALQESESRPEPEKDDDRDDSDSSSDSDSGTDSEEERRRKQRQKEKRARRKEKKRRNKKHKRDKDTKEKRIAKAMRQFDEDQNQETDERKRKYNSMYDAKAPTEEEMEAYYRKRSRPDDPMAAFLNSN